MIKTIHTTTCPIEINIEETETMLQTRYPGLRLIRESKDVVTNQWVYRVWFENEKDYTWFNLKQQ